MEQLTPKLGLCGMGDTEFCDAQESCRLCEYGRECFRRLAAYEDTGLDPEDITDFMERWHKVAELAGFIKQHDVDHLKELVQAEQDGRLVVLPCNAGDAVYEIFCNEIIPAVIEKVEINAFTNPRIWVQVGTEFMSSQCYRFDLSCGRDFYLTREEAEAALAREKEFEIRQNRG